MKRADLHVHSKYSDKPSEWLLKKIGTYESYTEIETVYQMAKQQGMDFVTITDHDTIKGSLLLHKKFPQDTFVGVEVTTTFPEDGCKMHLLVYDITEEQFAMVDKLREDIYLLRDYLKKAGIPHSLAHATYPVNGKLSMNVLEKLILLFDNFEGINGARNPRYNNVWTQTLNNLTPQHIDRLYKKHQIDPMSEDPWVKGITGGSDDHAGLFIAKTYTSIEANSKEEFLNQLLNKKAIANGRSNNFKGMAFMFYKIATDNQRVSPKKKVNRLFTAINNMIFENKGPSLKDLYMIQKLKYGKKERDRALARFLEGLDVDLVKVENLSNEEKVDLVYKNLASLSDELTLAFIHKFEKDFTNGEIFKVLKNLSSVFNSSFLSIPYLLTLKHLNHNRDIIEDLQKEYIAPIEKKDRKVLWFSDTIRDLNGVSATIRNMMQTAQDHELKLKLVTCLPDTKDIHQLERVTINLEPVFEYTPDFYQSVTLFFPSLLKSIEQIAEEAPDEIIISTPGPVGILGILVGKILGVKVSGIYHTDFTRQMEYIVRNGMMAKAFENFIHTVYGKVDEIRVPTNEYIDILSTRGLDKAKMSLFRRGIDTEDFKFVDEARDSFHAAWKFPKGFNLLYVGRVSRDKNIELLSKIYRQIAEQNDQVNLIIAGDGPHLDELKADLKGFNRVCFTGRLNRSELKQVYSAADLLVFPSTTDTFGMVVLEAHACELPVLVSNVGGPQEIVNEKQTGFILPVHSAQIWVDKIKDLVNLKEEAPEEFNHLRKQARQLVLENYQWKQSVLNLLKLEEEDLEPAVPVNRITSIQKSETSH